ncbi:transglycosylase SLT domain-containing protein [Staphylococcus hyicus]|uniref:transglycosylase SLT domain-containing protein n=1 Tax=Staphylococcus hyicus TaxID=1284 RepID=UPI00208F619C|nr:transglycosylase SLT domain-containing protein [Staphylococcus hyicus]MCO4329755.1 transglycosylase SLT domain-containing protein [Staphylococcus hyicus]MCO4332102.1 transglycosylase SLT domain-containing protein [Staphylococcus hyicus]MCO4337445.1 transglycosylase SLT domain-containing protein [Staphylococcus hyicus]
MDKYDKNVPSDYDGLFQKAADATGVSYDLLRKVAWTESRFVPTAKSKTGPLGMMQFTKATAKALGLRVTDGPDDDRLNPELAINAAAKHLAGLVGKFDGDELKAALAYNQGEGRLGNPQLEAYSKGDFASISEEGRNYMRNLLDVAKSPMAGQLETFGGITPKGKGIPAEVGLAGIGHKQKVTQELPESTSFDVKGIEQEAPAKPFAKDFWETHGETLDEYNNRSTFFGFKNAAEAELSNSVAGMAFRAGRLDNGFDVFKDTITPTRWNSHIWTPEELEKIRTEVKNPAYINVVTGGSPENLDDLIKLANENFENDSRAAEAGLGAKLSAGIIGAGVDPLSYVPMVGVTGKGFKLINKALVVGAESAALNVASEGLRTSVAGGDADYAGAALGGFVFGAGMSAISDAVAAGLKRSKPEAEFDNEFIGPMMRMEARETARNANSADLSRMNTENMKFEGEHNGVPYEELPTERGAVVLHDGSVLSASNPINPKTLKEFSEVDPEKAARGIKLAGFTEIGLKTLGSDDADIRRVAIDLVRSPTGMQSGASGKFGATASDIHERLHGTDQRTYNDLYKAMSDAMKDPEFSTGGAKMSREETRYTIYRRAALAIERPELQKALTPSERIVMDIIKRHFDTKRELMENPAIFGNTKAVSIFPESRHKGTYVPHVYDRHAKALMIQRYGAEGLQEGIARSWMNSYVSRPEVKARVDEMLKEVHGVKEVTPEMVEKYAMDKAYGISHSDQFTNSSIIEENIEGLVGIENNSFLEARNLFDSDLSITMPDGQQFSVNDLRDFDMFRIMPAYDRRINGDIAIMGSTGKTTKELKEEILALKAKAEGDGKKTGEVHALMDTVKILTGRARRNQDTVWETSLRSINDLGFFAKNAYMGAQNITEIAGMIVTGNVRALSHGIPILRDTLYKSKPVSAKELKELHASLFGKEVDQLIRPKRADIVQRLREATDTGPAVANIVGTLKYSTQELAARSPWTKLLNGTTNYLLDAARQGMLGDVISATLTGKTTRWEKEGFLRGASVTPEQMAGIKSLIKEHMVRGEDGKFTVKDKQAFSMDPRAMDLWRLADKVADEAMLRPHKVSLQDSHAFGALGKMVMQFKSFTIKSLNSKFLRTFYDGYKNNRAIDAALSIITSMGLAGGFYAMAAHVKAYALPKEKRKEYLERALDPTMIAHAALSRSSQLGAPLAMVDLVGGALGFESSKMARSTILPKDTTKERDPNKPYTSREVMGAMGSNLLEQMPSAGFVANVGATLMNAAGVVNSPNKATEQDFMTGLMNSTKELVPNDPLTQQLVVKIYEANGVNLRERRK